MIFVCESVGLFLLFLKKSAAGPLFISNFRNNEARSYNPKAKLFSMRADVCGVEGAPISRKVGHIRGGFRIAVKDNSPCRAAGACCSVTDGRVGDM